MPDDLYNDLGVSKDADAKEIKKAYRSESQKHHPDKGGDPEKFHSIALAYQVLSDPSRRKEYDETGSTEKKRGPEIAAEQVIYTWLNEILEQDSMPNDIVLELTDRIESGRTQLTKAKNQTQYRLKKFNRLLGRVSGGDQDNMVDNALKKKITDCEKQLEDIEEQFKVSECMTTMLEGYEDTDKTVSKSDMATTFLQSQPEAFGRMSTAQFRNMFGGGSGTR
jgi:DnaJ-class molecular chaperone